MIKIEIDGNKGKSSIEASDTGIGVAAEFIYAVFDIAKGIGDNGAFRKFLCEAISDEELFAQFCNAEKGETDDD